MPNLALFKPVVAFSLLLWVVLGWNDFMPLYGFKMAFVFFNLKMVNVLLFVLLLCVSLRKVSRNNNIMSKTNSLHYDLCLLGAKWLRSRKNVEWCEGQWKYVAVEVCVNGCENPDIWAFNGWSTIVVEVKTGRSDFLNDKKKPWHQAGMEHTLAGNYRYYLTPKGLLQEEDLPSGVGLLEYDGKVIVRVVRAKRHEISNHADGIIMASILRREGFKDGIYNYRGQPTTIKPKTVNGRVVR